MSKTALRAYLGQWKPNHGTWEADVFLHAHDVCEKIGHILKVYIDRGAYEIYILFQERECAQQAVQELGEHVLEFPSQCEPCRIQVELIHNRVMPSTALPTLIYSPQKRRSISRRKRRDDDDD